MENILAIEIALEVATRLGMKLNCHNIFLVSFGNILSIPPVGTMVNEFQTALVPGGDDKLNSRRRRIWSGVEIGVGM